MDKLPEMVSYYNEQLEILMQVPDDWRGQLLEGGQLRILSPEAPQLEGYSSTMSFRRGLPEGEGREGYEALIKASGESMQRDYADYQLRAEDRFTLSSGQPIYVRHYTWRDEESGVGFSQLQAFILQEGVAVYLINAATLEALSERYLPIFDAILRSIRLTPAA